MPDYDNSPDEEVIEKVRDDVAVLWAISQLGDLISEAHSFMFDGIDSNHWAAIGLAIKRLSDTLYNEKTAEAEGLEVKAREREHIPGLNNPTTSVASQEH